MKELLLSAHHELQSVHLSGRDNMFHMSNAFLCIEKALEQINDEEETDEVSDPE